MRSMIIVFMNRCIYIFFLLLFGSCFSHLEAVPLFLRQKGGTQSDSSWFLTTSDHFLIYTTQPNFSRIQYLVSELEYAFQIMAPFFDIPNSTTIPVIISSRTYGGGFANPATLNLELNIKQGGLFPIFIHEFTHRLMYEVFDPGWGPLGRILKLGVTPTWWLEGFAEILTSSIGRGRTQDALRFQALYQKFPSWAELHSLYDRKNSFDQFLFGYTTSHSFLNFLLNKYCPQNLNQWLCLKKFTKTLSEYTLKFPFINAEDQFTQEIAQKDASELYEIYKQEQQTQWTQKSRSLKPLNEVLETFQYLPASLPLLWWNKTPVPIAFQSDPWASFFLHFKSSHRDLSSLEYRKIQKKGGYLVTQSSRFYYTIQSGRNTNLTSFHKLLRYPILKNHQPGIGQDIPLGESEEILEMLGHPQGVFLITTENGVQSIKFWDEKQEVFRTLFTYDMGQKPSFVQGSLSQDSVEVWVQKARWGQELWKISLNKHESPHLVTNQFASEVAFLFRDHQRQLYAVMHGTDFPFFMRLDDQTVLKAFPDFLVSISWHPFKQQPILWLREGKGFRGVLFDAIKLSQAGQSENTISYFKGAPPFFRYPFESLSSHNGPIPVVPLVQVQEAPVDWKHFFTYPYPAFDVSSGLSFNLASVPLIDIMERGRIDLQLQIPFSNPYMTQGSLSFTSYRYLQGLNIKVSRLVENGGIYLFDHALYTSPSQKGPFFRLLQTTWSFGVSQKWVWPDLSQSDASVSLNFSSPVKRFPSMHQMHMTTASFFFNWSKWVWSRFWCTVSDNHQKLFWGGLNYVFKPQLMLFQSLGPIPYGWFSPSQWMTGVSLSPRQQLYLKVYDVWFLSLTLSPTLTLGTLNPYQMYSSLSSSLPLTRRNSGYLSLIWLSDNFFPLIRSSQYVSTIVEVKKNLEKNINQNYYVLSFDSTDVTVSYLNLIDLSRTWATSHALSLTSQLDMSVNGYALLGAVSFFVYAPRVSAPLGWGILLELGSADVF